MTAAMHANTSPTIADPALSQAPAPVPNGLHRASALSDIEREAAIKREAIQMEDAMARYEISGDFADRGEADGCRLRMEELIASRPVEVR